MSLMSQVVAMGAAIAAKPQTSIDVKGVMNRARRTRSNSSDSRQDPVCCCSHAADLPTLEPETSGIAVVVEYVSLT